MQRQKEADAFCFETTFLRLGNDSHWSVLQSSTEKKNRAEMGIRGTVTRGKRVGVADWYGADAGDAMAGLVGVCKRRGMHSITGSNTADADAGGPASQGQG